VRLAADFTRWTASPLPLNRDSDGTFEVDTQPLADGVHFYKYIVDGQWIADPSHPMVESDGCGGWNSVFGMGGPVLGAANQFRLVTLNLHTYQEADPLLKLEQVAFALAVMDADAVALQEVGEHVHDPGLPNAGEVVRTRLQALTGRPWEHAWRMAHIGFDVYREGVSLLAPVPLEDLREHRLSEGRLARNALTATVRAKGLNLRVTSAHLSWTEPGGADEISALRDALRSEPTDGIDAIVVAGDLNTDEDDPRLQPLLQDGFVDVARRAGAVFPTTLPQGRQGERAASDFSMGSRLDYQFLRPVAGGRRVRPVACIPVFNGLAAGDAYQPIVSDHLGVLAVYNGE
jgi:maltose 6'-phosphate phosphatase